ncbi:midasin-like isoform X5 [Mercenaria mercenaria]|uniref:midasin-like isoform X5 n=1 Tax=Mercenaria mercenaria TaxID=6596 RepID=UPI00234EF388|nr:midasin-like isoform X5 [Mercenaria mercenaria]
MRPRKGKENADCVSAEEKGILEVKFIDSYIGSGVFASDTIEKGQLVCYYEGELISGKDGIQRFNTPHDKGSFLFFFHHEGKQFCIDATHSSGCGRMINDDHRRPNCKVRVSLTGPKLAIYALKDVYKGDELRYDYKDTTAFWQRRNAPRKDIYTCPDPVEKNEKTTEMDAGGESSVNNTAEDTIQETEQSKQSSQEKLHTAPVEDDKVEVTEEMDAGDESSVNNTAEDTIQETEQSKQSSQEKLTGPIEDDKIEENEVMDADGENSVNNTAEDTIQETEQIKQSSQEKLHTAPVEDDKVEVTEVMDAGGESSVSNTAEDTIQETEQSKQSIISQMINLKENELDTFAGFLGHNIKVHREFDRLPEDTLQNL